MTGEHRNYRVGQQVRVSYTARVAEVGGTHSHGASRIIRLETTAIPTGWVDPAQEGLSIEVIESPMPTEPGVYWQDDAPDSQSNMTQWHTDGKAFFYLNTAGRWADLGWGAPNLALPFIRLAELPF